MRRRLRSLKRVVVAPLLLFDPPASPPAERLKKRQRPVYETRDRSTRCAPGRGCFGCEGCARLERGPVVERRGGRSSLVARASGLGEGGFGDAARERSKDDVRAAAADV
jgi:hypothetical protein